MKYEEWREDDDAEEWEEYLEQQEQTRRNFWLEKLYAAVGTFEPHWAGNVKFFQVKRMQDVGLKSIYEI